MGSSEGEQGNFKAAQSNTLFNKAENQDFYHLETQVFLSTGTGEYQEFTCKLFGSEIYFYKSDELAHDFMHTLVGTFVSMQDIVVSEESGERLFPILISLPPRYSRTVYFEKEEERKEWMDILRNVSLSYVFEDVYKTGKELGGGSMGVVFQCEHKETKLQYAVKHMKKAKKDVSEILY